MPTTTLLPTLLSGSIFGTALAVSGMYLPSTILSQLHLIDYRMLQTFMTASACTVFLVYIVNRQAGFAKLGHRTNSSLGRFGKYDANIIGGLVQGAAMTLTGACPGTVLVQMSLGIKTGWMTAMGCLLGAVWFVKYGRVFHKTNITSSDTQLKTQPPPPTTTTPANQKPKYTIMQKANLPTSAVVLLYEMFVLIALLSTSQLSNSYPPQRLSPSNNKSISTNPIVGGGLIGLAQACSVLLRNQTIGISGAWEEAGKWILFLFSSVAGSSSSFSSSSPTSRPSSPIQSSTPSTPSPPIQSSKPPKPPTSNLVFAIGVLLGSSCLRLISPSFSLSPLTPSPSTDLGPARCIFGGFIMIVGARLAGGCTSGHGLSGMATMSLSSFVTVAAMVTGGVLMGMVL